MTVSWMPVCGGADELWAANTQQSFVHSIGRNAGFDFAAISQLGSAIEPKGNHCHLT